MLAQVHSCAVVGLDAQAVHVEVDIASGLEKVTLVGLPDTAVRESSERVRAAIANSGFFYPQHRLTVNLTADLRKEKPCLRLAYRRRDSGRHTPGYRRHRRHARAGQVESRRQRASRQRHLADGGHGAQVGFRRLFVPASDAAEAALVKASRSIRWAG